MRNWTGLGPDAFWQIIVSRFILKVLLGDARSVVVFPLELLFLKRFYLIFLHIFVPATKYRLVFRPYF